MSQGASTGSESVIVSDVVRRAYVAELLEMLGWPDTKALQISSSFWRT